MVKVKMSESWKNLRNSHRLSLKRKRKRALKLRGLPRKSSQRESSQPTKKTVPNVVKTQETAHSEQERIRRERVRAHVKELFDKYSFEYGPPDEDDTSEPDEDIHNNFTLGDMLRERRKMLRKRRKKRKKKKKKKEKEESQHV